MAQLWSCNIRIRPKSGLRSSVMLRMLNFTELFFPETDAWRPTNFNYRGFKYHASRRLGVGMLRYRGLRHAHYRRLLAPPLSRPAVTAISTEMAMIAYKHVS